MNVLHWKFAYSAIGEERVTLLYQNRFYHGRICDTQHWLTAIKNAEYDKKSTEYEYKNTRRDLYAVTQKCTLVKQVTL